jgi:anti-sigma factor RsiW
MNHERCEAMRELVSALFDDELAGEERQAVQAHLDRCAACRDWLAQVRAARQRLQSYPRIEAAPGFNEAVMARVTAGPLTRIADALDRLICTPARQVAAGMAAALILSALTVWLALHVAVVSAPAPPRTPGNVAGVAGTFYEEVRPPSRPPRRHPPGPSPFEAERMRDLQRLGEH